MGTKIWFLPDGADRMAEIDFGRTCLVEGPFPLYDQSVQRSVSGAQSSVIRSGLSRITLRHVWNRGTRDASGDGDLLRRKLATLAAHLQRGGGCALAIHAEYARAGFATQLPASNASSVHVDVDLFKNLNVTGNVISGREIVVQTDHSRYLWEMKLCSTNSGRSFALQQNLSTDMTSAQWVLVREYFSYPAMRMPAAERSGRGFVSHDHEAILELDLPLEEDPETLDLYASLGGPIPGTSAGPPPWIDPGNDIDNPGGNYNPGYGWSG